VLGKVYSRSVERYTAENLYGVNRIGEKGRLKLFSRRGKGGVFCEDDQYLKSYFCRSVRKK